MHAVAVRTVHGLLVHTGRGSGMPLRHRRPGHRRLGDALLLLRGRRPVERDHHRGKVDLSCPVKAPLGSRCTTFDKGNSCTALRS